MDPACRSGAVEPVRRVRRPSRTRIRIGVPLVLNLPAELPAVSGLASPFSGVFGPAQSAILSIESAFIRTFGEVYTDSQSLPPNQDGQASTCCPSAPKVAWRSR